MNYRLPSVAGSLQGLKHLWKASKCHGWVLSLCLPYSTRGHQQNDSHCLSQGRERVRRSVWYIAMTSLQNHDIWEFMTIFCWKKKITRPLDGLLGTIVWSSRFPLGSHHRCFHSSEVSPTLPFCKNLSLFYIEPGISSAKLHRTVLLHFPRDLCFPVLAPNGVIVCVLIKTLRCITWPTWTMESKPVSLFREYVREFIFSLCHLFLPFKTRLILIPENFMVHCSPS